MRKLIINADDFGMNEEVNEGTKIGIKEGIVTSVSLMPNMPYFEDAVKFLRKVPLVSIGLHFNITEGKPLLFPGEVGSLLREDDSFYHWIQLGGRILFKQVSLEEIQEELRAQYNKIKDAGFKITHIDSHNHIHLYPSLYKIVNTFAEKQKITSRKANQFNIWNLSLGIRKFPTPTQVIINSLLFFDDIRYSFAHSSPINRFYDINWTKKINHKELLKILEHLPEGVTEIICHLAVTSETGNNYFLEPRFKVLRLLTQPTIMKHLTENGIKLVNRLSINVTNEALPKS